MSVTQMARDYYVQQPQQHFPVGVIFYILLVYYFSGLCKTFKPESMLNFMKPRTIKESNSPCSSYGYNIITLGIRNKYLK